MLVGEYFVKKKKKDELRNLFERLFLNFHSSENFNRVKIKMYQL